MAQPTLPRHVAVIMDGNGRWARERGQPRLFGHQRGAETLRAVTEECAALGIEFLTVYAFSTENWKRPQAEIDALMALLEFFLQNELPNLMANRIRLKTIGRIHDLPPPCRTALDAAVAATAQNTSTTLVLALSYSARTEIIDAVRSLCRDAAEGRISPEAVDPALFASRLHTAEIPDPDLLIRTSGEMRLSNFLLWQLSYTEIVVTQKLWPDFTREDLRNAISEFQRRERRFGSV